MIYWEYYLMGIILLPAIILSIYAQAKVHSTFNKYKDSFAECGKTGSEVARMFLDYAGLEDVKIIRSQGELTDYYNPKEKVIGLSEPVHDSHSVSAIGVACHEVGHALQYKLNYFPMKVRNAIIPICNFGSRSLWFLLFVGAFLYYSDIGMTFIWIGIGFFAFTVLLNLITLPIEFDASRRSLKLLNNSTVLQTEEVSQARKVLNAAALTYVAALAVSILNLLRLILVFTRRRE